MIRTLLLAASLVTLTHCSSLWDSYLGPRGGELPTDSGMTTDGSSTIIDMSIPGAACTASAQCPPTQWCNKAATRCEALPVLRSVYVPDASTVFVVGDGGLTLMLTDATNTSQTAWTAFPRVVSTQLNSVHGLSSNDVWAVGHGNTILRYTGSAWTSITSPANGKDLYSIYSVVIGGTTRRRAVGSAGARLAINGTGTTWVADTAAITAATLYGVTIAEFGGFYRSWAVGPAGTLQSEPQGGTWGEEPTLPMARDMYGIIWNGSDLHAVGKGGIALSKSFSGSWISVSSGTTQNLGSVSSTASTNVWAVGDANTVIQHNGTQYTQNSCNFAATNFWGVYSFAANNVWAVGENGTVCYWNGTQWFDRGLRN
jgi:hypothetical protein